MADEAEGVAEAAEGGEVVTEEDGGEEEPAAVVMWKTLEGECGESVTDLNLSCVEERDEGMEEEKSEESRTRVAVAINFFGFTLLFSSDFWHYSFIIQYMRERGKCIFEPRAFMSPLHVSSRVFFF